MSEQGEGRYGGVRQECDSQVMEGWYTKSVCRGVEGRARRARIAAIADPQPGPIPGAYVPAFSTAACAKADKLGASDGAPFPRFGILRKSLRIY